MKAGLFILGLILLSLNTNAKFSQVINISSKGAGIIKVDGFYTFENDDVKITYSFWAENGIMAFVIFNKSEKPIYIDWKKSSMIYNGKQNPYYTNKTTSNYSSFGTSYGSSWASIFGRISASSSTVNATETIVKQERVTFVPPHSYITNAFYDMLDNITAFSLDKKGSEQKEINGVNVYVNAPENPIFFRNFITYAATEDFAVEKYADNEFFVSKILTMHNHEFSSKMDDWEKTTRMYISDIKRKYVFE